MEFDRKNDEAKSEKTDLEVYETVEGFDIPKHLLEASQSDNVSEEFASSPQEFGIHAHVAYADAAQDAVTQDSDTEMPVIITNPHSPERMGRIDFIADNKIIDFKTNDMREWTEADARIYAEQHGSQMQDYVNSPDTPVDASGWIVATVPPIHQAVRDVYSEVLKNYKVEVRFSPSESSESVGEIVSEIVDQP